MTLQQRRLTSEDSFTSSLQPSDSTPRERVGLVREGHPMNVDSVRSSGRDRLTDALATFDLTAAARTTLEDAHRRVSATTAKRMPNLAAATTYPSPSGAPSTRHCAVTVRGEGQGDRKGLPLISLVRKQRE
jgi:hypothetical protein